MSRKAGPLVGLKHVVRPAVLRGEIKVRLQNTAGIGDEFELRLGRANTGARDITGSIHLASSSGGAGVAHLDESRMGVAQIVLVRQGNGSGTNRATSGVLVQPVVGLNIVLGTGGRGAAKCLRIRRRAQPLEEIVGSTVFLNNHNDML